MSKEEFESRTEPITLQAWSRIEGTVRAGSKPLPNAPASWSMEVDRDIFGPSQARFHWHSDKELTADANGHYSFRVFPGKGTVGRLANSGWNLFLTQPFDIKPGESLTIDIGGGGYFVKGQVVIPPNDTPKPVDWRFAHVVAKPHRSEFIVAVPALSEAASKLQEAMNQALIEAFRNHEVSGLTREQVQAISDQVMGTSEMKALMERNSEAHAELTRNAELIRQHKVERDYWSDMRPIYGTMDEQGNFQLDDMTPGNWTLEVELNFPSAPGQHWDFADTWKTKVNMIIPELPDDYKDKPLQLGQIQLGFDKSNRKGPGW